MRAGGLSIAWHCHLASVNQPDLQELWFSHWATNRGLVGNEQTEENFQGTVHP